MSWPLRSVSSLLVALFLSMTAAAPSAAASKARPPEIDAFYADPGNQFSPGTEITFTIEGTPKGKASVRITGIPRTIPLSEVDEGVYEGSYTIRSRDKFGPNTTARGTLKARGRTIVSELQFKPPPVAAAPAPPPAPAAPAAPKVDRFTVTPIEKLDPGADLKFTLMGTPGAKASVSIEGVAKDIPLREVKSGQYEGTYTIRRLDHFPANVAIVGTLDAGGQLAQAKLGQALIVDAKPPVLKNLYPREAETVAPGAIALSATFDDSGGLGVDPKSVRIVVDGKDVTAASTITGQYFTHRVEATPGSHRVEVNARDMAGNAMRHTWTFTVAATPAPLPLQIISHANNAGVPPGGAEVRGRTAPGATVDVTVNMVASVAGFSGMNQQILNQSLRADPNGNFVFRVQPPISVPGVRYDINLKARTAQASRDMQLVLFQQR